MAFQKINDNLYLNQALVVSCGVMQKGSKNIYTLKLNSGVDVNLTDICPNNEMAEAIYNQVKAWEGGGGGGPVGPLEDLMYDDEHTLSEVMDTKLEGDVKDLVYDSETGDTVGETLAEMQEDIDAPLKDKEYGTVTETITVEDEFVDGQTYSIVKDIPFTEEELALLDSLDNGTEFYFEPDPEFNWKNKIAWQTTDGSYIYFNRNDENIPESYYPFDQKWEIDGNDMYDEYVNEYGEAPSFIIHTEYINSQYEGLLKKIFGLSSHTETITRTLTLEEKFDDFSNWKFQDISNKVNPITAGTYKLLPEYTQELEEEIVYEMGGYVAGLISGITSAWQWVEPQSGDTITFLQFYIDNNSYVYNYILGQWFMNSADQNPVNYEDIPAFEIQDPIQTIGSDVIFRQICLYEDGTPIPPYKEEKIAETKVGDFPNWLIQGKGQQMLGSIDWDKAAQIIEQNGWSEYTSIYDDSNINPNSYVSISFAITSTPEGETGTNYYIMVYTNDQNYKQTSYYNYRYGLNLDDPSSSTQHVPANTWWQSGYGPMGYFQLIRHNISDEAQTVLNKEICNLVFSGNEVSYKSLQETLDNVPQGLAKDFIYDKISGESGVQPVFDLMSVIQENQELFAETFGSISDATVYGSEGDMQHWACVFQKVDDEPVFMWGKQIDTDTHIYKFTLSTSKWTTFTINSSTGPSLEEPVLSQEELPIIDDYDESLIQEGFEEIVPLMIIDSQGGDVAINLEQKFNEPLKNKIYEISTTSAFYDVPKWSKINVTDTAVVYRGLGTVVRVMIANPGDYGVFVEIRAVGSTSSYRIQSFNGYGDNADTWYPEKPVIQYDASAVNPEFEDIWKAIYQTPGAVTLEEKLNSIGGSGEDEELKNKTYGTEVTVLSTPVLVNMPATTEVQPKVGGILPEIEGLPSSQSENQLPIYFDDQVLITYYYYRQGSTSGWMENFSGYRVFTVDNQMFDYQELYNSSTRNEWAGISDQNNAPTIAGLWTTLGARPVPIGYRSEVPNYYDCQYISSYELVTRKPAMWDQAYQLFYYYDSDNDEYYPISEYEPPVWGEQDVYTPVFSYLDSEPQDWENIYNNGEYFDPTAPFAIIQSIFCRVQKQTFTLEQKVNQIGYSSAYITDLPTEPNLSGRLIIVLCSEEPEYKYDGYLYIVAEDADLTPYTSGAQDSGNSGGGGSQIDPGMITPAPMPAP